MVKPAAIGAKTSFFVSIRISAQKVFFVYSEDSKKNLILNCSCWPFHSKTWSIWRRYLDLNGSQRLNLVQLKVSQKVKEPTTFPLVCKIRVYVCAKLHVLFLTIKRYGDFLPYSMHSNIKQLHFEAG